MQDGDQHLRLRCDRPLELYRPCSCSGFQGSLEPLREHGEMQTNLGLNFLRQGGHLGSEKCAYTERESLAFDAAFPVFEVAPDAYQGILELIVERFHPLRDPGPVAPEDRDYKSRFRREMMVNASLTYLYSLRNIGVTER